MLLVGVRYALFAELDASNTIITKNNGLHRKKKNCTSKNSFRNHKKTEYPIKGHNIIKIQDHINSLVKNSDVAYLVNKTL